jgi:hypothetical protein
MEQGGRGGTATYRHQERKDRHKQQGSEQLRAGDIV